jgi:hypothetical protein
MLVDLENVEAGVVDQSREALNRPVYVQAAYQYTRVVGVPLGSGLAGSRPGSTQALPAAADQGGGGGAGGSSASLASMAGGGGGARRFEVQRRLRVATFR